MKEFNMKEAEWKRNGKKITEPIIDYLEKMFEEELALGRKLTVSVGTDSTRGGAKGAYRFATAIMIVVTEDMGGGVTQGRGGKLIATTYSHQFKSRDKELVKERMVFEVARSIDIAYELSPLVNLYDIPLEVHADINPNPRYESNKALAEAVGYILGMGYSFKIKPEAFAASYAADKKC